MKKLMLFLLIGIFMISFSSAALTVTLNSPADESTFYSNPVTFNATAEVTGGATLTNMSLFTNESGSWSSVDNKSYGEFGQTEINQTGISVSFSSSGSTEKLLIKTEDIDGYVWNDWEFIGRRSSDTGSSVITVYLNFTYSDGTSEEITAGTITSSSFATFSGNVSTQKPIETLYIYSQGTAALNIATIIDSFNVTRDVKLQELSLTFNQTLTDDIIWNVQSCDSDGNCGFATSNYTLFIDTSSPTISIETPTETLDYNYVGGDETLNVTFTDAGLNSCWYDYNGTNVTIEGCTTGVKNSTTFTLEENNYNMTVWANDTLGNYNSSFIDWDYQILETSRTHNTTSYETARESYSINVTANSSLTAVSLNFNGTYYPATKSGTVWTYSMDIPSSIENKTIGWKFTYGGATINSDYTTYQNIEAINLTYCTSGTPFINFTFKDEGDDSIINATIPTSTLTYYLGNGDATKTLIYVNTTAHYAYAFCFNQALPLNLDYRIQYESEDYPQRTSEPDTFKINGTTTDKTLYLLGTIDGIYVTFQVINTANQLISGVDVTATRSIDETDVIVGTGTTSASGSVTFWLNPDFIHDFVFSKTGYVTYENSEAPTQNSYTVTLSSYIDSVNSSFQGMIKSIRPTETYLINDTIYTFAFNLSSTWWDVSEYGFSLRLANGTTFDGGSSAVVRTELTLNYNTTNQTVIYMDYYWLINGNYTNRTAKWIVFNTDNTGWSLATFFEDLEIYLDSGIFGLDNFGRILITFLILFISVGIMSFKYGFTSPMSITSMIFAIIYFMDVTTPIMPDITLMNGIVMENLPTFLAGLALILVIFNEVRTR